MKDRGTVSDRATTQDLYNLATSAPVLRMSEDRHNEIIKLMYSKVDIDQHVKTLTRLTTTQQKQLATVLKQYDGMYEGQTGTLKIPPVHIELKEGAKPYATRPFPVPL